VEAVGNDTIEQISFEESAEVSTFIEEALEQEAIKNDFFAKFGAKPQEEAVVGQVETETIRESKSSEELFRQTAEQLVDFYGDQQFSYGKYSGTITDILSSCSVIRSAVYDGFDAVFALIDGYKVEALVKEDDEVTKDDEDNEPNRASNKVEEPKTADGHQQKNEHEVKKETPPQQPKSDRAMSEAPIAPEPPVADEKVTQLKAGAHANSRDEVSAAARDDKEPVVKRAVDDEALLSLPASELTEPKSPEQTEDVDAIEFSPVPSPLPGLKNTEYEVMPTPPVEPEAVIPAEYSALVDEEAMTDSAMNEDIEEPLPVTVSTKEKSAAPTHVKESDELIEAPRNLTQEVVDEVLDVEMEPVKTVEDELIEHFDTWQNLAKEETPLDELFETMAEQLQEVSRISSVFEAELDLEENLAQESETSDSTEQPISNEALLQEARPELLLVLQKVQAAHYALEFVYQAKTKEECEVYVEQVVVELSLLLRSLGYENAEAIVRAYLYTHSPETLRALIKVLEDALWQRIAAEVHQRHAYKAKHHVRLSKIASFIMRVLHPQTILATH
jgi:hypothetical protein